MGKPPFTTKTLINPGGVVATPQVDPVMPSFRANVDPTVDEVRGNIHSTTHVDALLCSKSIEEAMATLEPDHLGRNGYSYARGEFPNTAEEHCKNTKKHTR